MSLVSVSWGGRLGKARRTDKVQQLLVEVLTFVRSSSGLKFIEDREEGVCILQEADRRSFRFLPELLSEVLPRLDSDGRRFLQVNFSNGEKVLVTDTLVGFKPRETSGLDMARIPRVVTTPDLVSVLEAIEDSLASEAPPEQEVEVLKRVYLAILQGAEAVGFELIEEREWASRLPIRNYRASA